MHQFQNALDETVKVPEIDYTVARRLKNWDVCDLLSIINDAEKWTDFFGRLTSDMEFIVNVGYAVLHSELGTDEQQTAFAESLSGHGKGSESLIELSEALREAVIDFFPASRRDAIRQFWSMTVTTRAAETLQKLLPDTSFTGFDLVMPGSGASTCSESSERTANGSAFETFVSDSTASATTTESNHPQSSLVSSTHKAD